MNTPQTISVGSAAANSGLAIDPESITPGDLYRSSSPLGQVLSIINAVTFIVLAVMLSTAAFGANPLEELPKTGPITGGVDPHGDSWQSIQNSVQQFLQPQFVLRMFLGFSLAVACAWVVGWHPRRSKLGDPLSDIEERKTLIILGLVGAVVAELSGNSSTLAFVIFGIGALLRFRTALDNPKLTGKAIMVVIIGLACGMGSWVMAVFVTAFTWFLVFWLDSHVGCRLRIRLDDDVDPEPVFGVVQSLLVSRHCRLQSSELNVSKGQMVFLMLIPSELDPKQLEADLRAKLPQPKDARIEFQAM